MAVKQVGVQCTRYLPAPLLLILRPVWRKNIENKSLSS